MISNGTLQVFDLLGKQIINQSVSSDITSQIDLTDWDTGMYLIKISSNNGEETKRFIKN